MALSKKLISIVVVIFIASVIFMLSAQNGRVSDDVSEGFLEKILTRFVDGFEFKNSAEQREMIDKYHAFTRKLAHFSIYMLLGIALCCFIYQFKIRNPLKKSFVIGIGSVYAITDEVHQFFVSGRSGQLSDVLIDTVGVIIGLIIFLMIYKLKKCKIIKIKYKNN